MHIKPKLMNLMVSSELYCQACNNMFGDSSLQWQGTSGEDYKIDNYKLSTVSEIYVSRILSCRNFLSILSIKCFVFIPFSGKKYFDLCSLEHLFRPPLKNCFFCLLPTYMFMFWFISCRTKRKEKYPANN